MATRRTCLAALVAWPALGRTQGAALRRIGVLAPSTAAKEALTLRPFFEQMRQLGWVEGGTVAYDRSFADDQNQELPRLAREMVARRPELIFAPPLTAAVSAKAATDSIPIVFASGTDPVAAGLVQSLAWPGGNATGLVSVVDSLAPKRLELLLELMPKVRRIGLLGEQNDVRMELDRQALAQPLAARGIQLRVGAASNPQNFDAAVAALLRENVEVIMTNSTISFNLRERLIQLLQGRHVAVAAHRTEMVHAGALLSYSGALHEQLRRAALVCDKILRGARPADIPVEQPSVFVLAINRRVARELGVGLPSNMLLRADEVVD